MARQNALILDRWTLLRFTSRDVTVRASTVVESVLRALAA
jgi:hypothetical protein